MRCRKIRTENIQVISILFVKFSHLHYYYYDYYCALTSHAQLCALSFLRPTFVGLGLHKVQQPLSTSLRLTPCLPPWRFSQQTRKSQGEVPRTVILVSCHPFHDRASGGWGKKLVKLPFSFGRKK